MALMRAARHAAIAVMARLHADEDRSMEILHSEVLSEARFHGWPSDKLGAS